MIKLRPDLRREAPTCGHRDVIDHNARFPASVVVAASGQSGNRLAETDRPFCLRKQTSSGRPLTSAGTISDSCAGEGHGSPDLVKAPGRIIASAH